MNWAYVSGFFDGEGCLSASSKSKSYLRRLSITITQKDPKVLHEIRDFLGYGRVSLYHKSWGVCGVLKITSQKNQRDFLQGIYPYSVVKTTQIEVALRLIDLNGGRGRKVSPEVREERERLGDRLVQLKKSSVVIQ